MNLITFVVVTLTLPWMGNLAVIKACVASLNGLKGLTILNKEAKTPTVQHASFESLRITSPLKFLDKTKVECHFEGSNNFVDPPWLHFEGSEDIWLVDLHSAPSAAVSDLLRLSGTGAIFVTRLAKNITTMPPAQWFAPEDKESPTAYLQRTQAMGASAFVL